MDNFCTIQVFLNNEWIDCATVELRDLETKGWLAKTATYYLFDYAIDYINLKDNHALSNYYPVTINSNLETTWPAFLMDLLPQGYGRRELLKKLGHSEYAQELADWSLLRAGASNCIGNLRVKEAHEWLLSQYSPQPIIGFSLEEIIQRGEQFLEYLTSLGLFINGSTGVQGEWPKLLLTQSYDDLFYLDHTLPDNKAKQHWLVKFSRGRDERLNKILMHEPLYMQLAEYLGLNVFKKLELYGKTLFIPRFDRKVENNCVERIAQESLASFGGKAGFGVAMTHNEVCQLIMKYCSHPELDIIEYIKRDLANIALGNKDNHTRNTAFQRLNNGCIQLTPLYDFTPTWMHPDGISRCTRWENDDTNWREITNYILQNTSITEDQIKYTFTEQLDLYKGLLTKMESIGIDYEIIENCKYRIQDICQQLTTICHR
ncbi:type II toxin-antitoxin system HipA family toxin [Acinetobacter sp. YH16032]|uniref:type II toxin-antitoxin system HipA family toxin n=1 Tax=Acinetobacter sp. YH16032 TaxID=2601181 RepID=UPI0015D2CA1B|nr:HipA domain-containing protein [Acinetobacter sp. YH16032]